MRGQRRPYCNARTRHFGPRLSLFIRALFSVAVKLSQPKRLLNASAVAASGKQNRIWIGLTSYRLRPRRTGMRRSRWNAPICSKTSRKPSGGSASSTRCGKSRSFVSRTNSLLRRVISPDPLPPRASPPGGGLRRDRNRVARTFSHDRSWLNVIGRQSIGGGGHYWHYV